jgi:hypothetical protein
LNEPSALVWVLLSLPEAVVAPALMLAKAVLFVFVLAA